MPGQDTSTGAAGPPATDPVTGPATAPAADSATATARLADELLEVVLDSHPVYATLFGLPGRDDRLPDYAAGAREALRDRAAAIAGRAAATPPPPAAPDRVTLAVVRELATGLRDTLATRSVEYTVTDSFAAPVPELLGLLAMVPVAGPDHADGYLARLRALPAVLATVAERHREGVAAGRAPVRRLVEATVGYLDRYLADPDADPLRRPEPPADGPVDLPGFVADRDRLLAEQVRPAVAGYREALAELAPRCRPEDQPGLCWLPEGRDWYAALVASHTTSTLTAAELHEIGRDLIARLDEEYRRWGEPVFGLTDPAAVRDRLRTDPALRWRDGEELLAATRAAVRRAEAAAPAWFGRLPEQECEVRPVPELEAPGASGAYYAPPALDGSRPGCFFVNLHRATEEGRAGHEAVAFHEAVPGHHLQLTRAQELADLPVIRRLSPFTAYDEGWGLYAERLADEMGLYSGDLARLGMVDADALRTARLVVDTGLHEYGWSRQRAVDYLTAHTALPAAEIGAEVDRYLAMPGQALAYLVGRLEIQRLRAEAERALGDRFDIRAFHDTVLGTGGVPLTVLAEVVRA